MQKVFAVWFQSDWPLSVFFFILLNFAVAHLDVEGFVQFSRILKNEEKCWVPKQKWILKPCTHKKRCINWGPAHLFNSIIFLFTNILSNYCQGLQKADEAQLILLQVFVRFYFFTQFFYLFFLVFPFWHNFRFSVSIWPHWHTFAIFQLPPSQFLIKINSPLTNSQIHFKFNCFSALFCYFIHPIWRYKSSYLKTGTRLSHFRLDFDATSSTLLSF